MMAFIIVVEINISIGAFHYVGRKYIACHHGCGNLPCYFGSGNPKLPNKKAIIPNLVPFINLAVFPELTMVIPKNITVDGQCHTAGVLHGIAYIKPSVCWEGPPITGRRAFGGLP